MAERFPSVASFGEYRDKVLRFLNVENEDILSSMVRALTFDETGYKGSEMYVVKPVGRIDHEKQYIYLEHGKCLYTTLLVCTFVSFSRRIFWGYKTGYAVSEICEQRNIECACGKYTAG